MRKDSTKRAAARKRTGESNPPAPRDGAGGKKKETNRSAESSISYKKKVGDLGGKSLRRRPGRGP